MADDKLSNTQDGEEIVIDRAAVAREYERNKEARKRLNTFRERIQDPNFDFEAYKLEREQQEQKMQKGQEPLSEKSGEAIGGEVAPPLQIDQLGGVQDDDISRVAEDQDNAYEIVPVVEGEWLSAEDAKTYRRILKTLVPDEDVVVEFLGGRKQIAAGGGPVSNALVSSSGKSPVETLGGQKLIEAGEDRSGQKQIPAVAGLNFLGEEDQAQEEEKPRRKIVSDWIEDLDRIREILNQQFSLKQQGDVNAWIDDVVGIRWSENAPYEILIRSAVPTHPTGRFETTVETYMRFTEKHKLAFIGKVPEDQGKVSFEEAVLWIQMALDQGKTRMQFSAGCTEEDKATFRQAAAELGDELELYERPDYHPPGRDSGSNPEKGSYQVIPETESDGWRTPQERAARGDDPERPNQNFWPLRKIAAAAGVFGTLGLFLYAFPDPGFPSDEEVRQLNNPTLKKVDAEKAAPTIGDKAVDSVKDTAMASPAPDLSADFDEAAAAPPDQINEDYTVGPTGDPHFDSIGARVLEKVRNKDIRAADIVRIFQGNPELLSEPAGASGHPLAVHLVGRVLNVDKDPELLDLAQTHLHEMKYPYPNEFLQQDIGSLDLNNEKDRLIANQFLYSATGPLSHSVEESAMPILEDLRAQIIARFGTDVDLPTFLPDEPSATGRATGEREIEGLPWLEEDPRTSRGPVHSI